MNNAEAEMMYGDRNPEQFLFNIGVHVLFFCYRTIVNQCSKDALGRAKANFTSEVKDRTD